MASTTTTTAAAAPSWGSDLQKYQQERSILPWGGTSIPPAKHVTRYEKSREERLYDPIIGRFRDLNKEQQVTKKAQNDTINMMNRAKDKQMRYTQKFNLINHELRSHGLIDKSASDDRPLSKTIDTRLGYNIVSGLEFKDHHYLPPNQRPTGGGAAVTKGSGRATFQSLPTRDFNMISNKYLRRHEEKTASDASDQKSRAAEKFWKTNSYNPVTVSFYDENRESEFLKTRTELEKTHGNDVIDRLPDRTRNSEGRTYDIINKTILDEEKFITMSNISNRSLKNKNTVEVERRMRREADARSELYGTRALNRISYQKLAEPYAKGYDILTTQPYEGLGKKDKPELGAKPKPPVWDRLNAVEKKPAAKLFRDLSGRSRTSSSNNVVSVPRDSGSSSTAKTSSSSSSSALNVVPKLNLTSNSTTNNSAVRTGGF